MSLSRRPQADVYISAITILVPTLCLGTHLPWKLCFPILKQPPVRSRYRINNPTQAHFITATIVNWLPMFTTAGCCDIILRSFAYCREHKALRIFAWVILDTHVHAIVAGPDLADTLGNLKKFTAREILSQLETEGRDWLRKQLEFFCARHKALSAHQVWQEGVHPQSIPSDSIMLQKLEYLHNNPVKRGLVASPEHWRYSSAHEWLQGADLIFRVDDWRAGLRKQSFQD